MDNGKLSVDVFVTGSIVRYGSLDRFETKNSITATSSHSLSQPDTCDEMYWGQRHCPLLLPLYTFAVYGILIGSLAGERIFTRVFPLRCRTSVC